MLLSNLIHILEFSNLVQSKWESKKYGPWAPQSFYSHELYNN